MQHLKRWDLPKGHCDGDETFLETAIRETSEETGIAPSQYQVDPSFEFELNYSVDKKRYGNSPVQKQVRYFLAWTAQKREISLTEHIGFKWFKWSPPHLVQEQTIDPLLNAVADFLNALQR